MMIQQSKYRIAKFIIAIVLISGFVMISITPDRLGVWHHDSGKYYEQGYNILGKWPPVYPVLLRAIGRDIVRFQLVLGMLSWCFLGYILAGFPGLIFAGVVAITPWFTRWHGQCLTESISHSLAALVVAFSVLLIKNFAWYGVWFVSLFIFVLTRFTNLFIVPFCVWPALFCRRKMRYFIIVGVALVIVPGYYIVSGYQAGHQVMPGAGDTFKAIAKASIHRQALMYMFNAGERPYYRGEPIKGDYAHYMPRLSRYSNYLQFVKVAKYQYLWLLLLPVAIVNRKSIYSFLILSLFLASYTQAIIVVLYEGYRKSTEPWRHLFISDCFYIFAILAGIGLFRQYVTRKGKI